MGRMSVQTLKANLQNPARIYLWEMFIPIVPGGGDIDALRTRCQTSVIPGVSSGNIHIDYKGTGGFNVPGRLRFPQTITLEFLEGEDSKIFDTINSWRQLITDHLLGVGEPDVVVKVPMYLKLITKQDTEWNGTLFQGAWPQDRADVPLNYTTDAEVRFSVTFQYDLWTPISTAAGADQVSRLVV